VKVQNRFLKNPIATVALFCMLPVMAAGQQFARIKTAKGEAVEDAIIVYHPVGLKSFQKVAITNSTGRAAIEADAAVELIISKIGFTTLRDTLAKGESKNYTLVPNQVNLKDVVVTGQFEANTTQNAVQQIRVIDRKRIEQQGAVNLRDVLTNELNIRLSQDGVLGSQMSMMGLGGQNVKILIDGVPVIGRMDGNIDLSQINLNNIERIEIIEGPMSVIYGTDALGGVINLITKKPSGKQYALAVNSYYETVGTYNVDANVGFKHKNLAVTISGGRNYFDGFSTVTGDSIRAQQWKPREQYFGDIQLTYKFKKQSHRLYTQGFNETITSRNNPNITAYTVTGFDDYFITNRWNYSLYSDFYFNNKACLNLINSFSTYERRKNSYIKNLVTGTEQLTPNPEDHDTTTFDLLLMRGTYTTHNATVFNSQMGYDINLERGTGKRLEDHQQSIGDYAAFYIAEIKLLDKLTLNQGVRFIYNTRYGAPVIPSFNIKYDITKKLAFRGSYAQGFRAPSLKELFLYFVDVNHYIIGNPDLKAETSYNFLASVAHVKEYQKGSLKTDISGFYNNVSNMISLVLQPNDVNANVYTYRNIGHYETKGMNISSTVKYKNIAATLGYSYIGRLNQQDSLESFPPFSYSNEIRANTTYTVTKTKTDLSVFVKYNGALPGYQVSSANTIEQTWIQAYTMVDASITQPFLSGRISFTVGAKNLANITSITSNTASSAHSSGSTNMSVSMGRYFFTSIRINIAKK
jgi:outer membrane receptor for ferrienterochelin and colicins